MADKVMQILHDVLSEYQTMILEHTILDLLESYRCSGWAYENGQGMSLLDVLASPMSEDVGAEELRLLAEHLAEEITVALAQGLVVDK